MVMDLCVILAENECSFEICGFGQLRWPVDVKYDLSTFIEQLPEALRCIKDRVPVEVDLYGQGIERSLKFETKGEFVHISCESRTGWVPRPDVEKIGYLDLLSMLESVASEFTSSLRLVWPQLGGRARFVIGSDDESIGQ
ncbi:hypothetical protein [Amycolatopsis sp. NPDC021455]|uniref:hypothetical protein n=1 Tax=Amycolatopsis sp. NPDC021455 TaxID=3154901 RepID=UPI0033F85CB8